MPSEKLLYTFKGKHKTFFLPFRKKEGEKSNDIFSVRKDQHSA